MKKHFTATAFVIDSHRRALLLWHKRLKRWMPPGGHIDPNETPEDAAARECKEETGLDVEIIGRDCKVPMANGKCSGANSTLNIDHLPLAISHDLFADCSHEGNMLKTPIAMLLENIPDCPERGEPAHQHMDFLFLAKPLDESQKVILQEDESSQMRWFTREEIEKLDGKTEIFENVKEYILQIL